MRKNSRRVWIGLLVAALAAIAWIFLRPHREPVYDGKPLSYWLRHPLRTPMTNPVPGISLRGMSVDFPKMDSNAIPFLIKALERPDGSFDGSYSALWHKLSPRLRSHMPSPLYPGELRVNVALILMKMGTNAKPAIPALIRILKSDKSENARFSAATCLRSIGREDPIVRAAFIEALNDKSQSSGVRMSVQMFFWWDSPKLGDKPGDREMPTDKNLNLFFPPDARFLNDAAPLLDAP